MFNSKPQTRVYPPKTFYLNSVLDFGKYKGKKVEVIEVIDPGYLKWIARETEHTIVYEKNAMIEQSEKDQSWKSVTDKVLRVWASGINIKLNRCDSPDLFILD